MADDAPLLASRVRHLQEVTARATIAPTVDEIGQVLVQEGVAALGGAVGALWFVAGDALVLARWHGKGRTPAHERVALDADHPMARAVATGRPIWLDEHRRYREAFPASAERPTEALGASEIAMAFLPLLASTRVVGVFLCAFGTQREFPVDERVFLMSITRQCAVAIERLQLIASERELRLRAERLAAGMATLQALAGELSLVVELADVARVVLDRGRAAVGAATAGIWVRDGDDAVLLDHRGYAPATVTAFARVAYAGVDTPIGRALAGGAPVFLPSRQDYQREFPTIEARTRAPGQAVALEAAAAIPMIVDGHALGAVSFGWAEPHPFDAGERELLVLMLRHVGQAVERARLHAAQERTRTAQRMLADAGAVLASSLDYHVTLQAIADRLVPDAADWCFIDLQAEDGGFDRVAVAHADPSQAGVARAFKRRFAPLPNAAIGTSRLLDRHEPQLVAEVSAEMLASVIRDEAHRDAQAALDLRSVVTAPLRAGGRVFGALVLASTSRRFDALDLELCVELARRVGTAIDNARLYSAEAAARREAEAANRTKDEFLAMLGHELRNPLAPIITALQLMRERDAGTGAFARERSIVERQIHHLGRLVDDLLDVSRIARGKIALRRAPVELATAVAQAVEATAPLVEERGHALAVDVPAGLVLDADLDRVAQVVANLVINAARYTPRGGRIAIDAVPEPGAVRLAVRDSGPGIAPDLLPTLFEPFVQGARGVDRAEGGLGLGLAIVRNLVEQHGGRVVAANPPAGGAELSVWLPAAAPAGPKNALAAPPPALTARALRVLLVDDNVDAAEMLGELLRVFGHEPIVVHAGAAALAAATRAPDLAFLDIGLPDIDGYELARRLRALPGFAAVPLVALTGYGQAADRANSRAAGFTEHLVKPLDIGRLRAILDAVATVT